MIRWRIHRANDGDRYILVPHYFEPTAYKSLKRSNFPQMATWIGAVSQAAMLLVVLFGYIYTVRPVFQHQLVQEKLASAELDRLEVEEQIQILQDERDETVSNLHEVQSQINSVEVERERLVAELQEAKVRASQAQSDASRLEGIVQEQLRELKDARWELLMIDFTFAGMLNDVNVLNRDWTERESVSEYLQRHRDEWREPFVVLQSSIAELRKKNADEPRYPESYINEFSEFIESRKSELTCIAPPFDDLQILFRERSSEIREKVEEKTDEHIDDLILDHRKRGEQVRITDEFRRTTAQLYRIDEEFNLERELKDKVRGYLENCRFAAQNVVSEFRNLKGVTH